MDLVKAYPLGVLQQFDARAPRVENEPMLEHAWQLAQRRSIFKALEAHARASHSYCFQFRHFRLDVRIREGNVVDAGALRTAHGGLDDEDQLHAIAVGRVAPIGYRLAVEVPAVPAHRLRWAGGGDLHVVEVRGEDRRHQTRRGNGS